MKMNLLLIFL